MMSAIYCSFRALNDHFQIKMMVIFLPLLLCLPLHEFHRKMKEKEKKIFSMPLILKVDPLK